MFERVLNTGVIVEDDGSGAPVALAAGAGDVLDAAVPILGARELPRRDWPERLHRRRQARHRKSRSRQ